MVLQIDILKKRADRFSDVTYLPVVAYFGPTTCSLVIVGL
jgi:hypothetical protein